MRPERLSPIPLAARSPSARRIATLTDPAGGVYRYRYDANDNLASVHYRDDTPSDDSDNPKRLYHYEDSRFAHALTGIMDEAGHRFATYAYDEKGRAILSEHAGGAERVQLGYNADGTTTVTDPQGAVRHYAFETHQGVIKVKSIQGGPCPDCSQTQNHTYDASRLPHHPERRAAHGQAGPNRR